MKLSPNKLSHISAIPLLVLFVSKVVLVNSTKDEKNMSVQPISHNKQQSANMAVVQPKKLLPPSTLASGEVMGRSGRPIKIVDRSSTMTDSKLNSKNNDAGSPATVPRQPSVVDLEQMRSRQVQNLKVCMEDNVLVSAWLPILGTEFKIDFVPDTDTVWKNRETIQIVKGRVNSSLDIKPYAGNCHFKSSTPSALAVVSTCNGKLTGSVMIKNEICVLDMISSRQLINVCHRPVVSFDIEVTEDGTVMGTPTLDKMYQGFFDSSAEQNETSVDNRTMSKVDDEVDIKNASTSTTSTPTSQKLGDSAEKATTNTKPLKSNKEVEESYDKDQSSEKSTIPQFVYIDSEETDPLQLDWIHKKAPFILHRRKRSTQEAKKDDTPFCGLNSVENVPIDPYELDGAAVMANAQTIDYSHWKNDLVIELAVFADSQLWARYVQKFGGDASRQLQDFITSILNNAQLMYQHDSINPKLKFSVVRYEVFEVQPEGLGHFAHNPDANSYLQAFCRYQNMVRSREFNWDHSILFTGSDILRGGYDKSISGIARLNGVCEPFNSCLLAEALDFNAAFIVAHEMGHSLGMKHDEPYCPSSFIMSQSLGAGKVVWSSCSISAFQKYLNRLDNENRNCMVSLSKYDEPKFKLGTSVLPGQKYNADNQCALMYGHGYYREAAYHTSRDICYMIWCRQRNGPQYFSSHPALEGTTCDYNKHCISGSCVPVTQTYRPFDLAPANSGWSLWSKPQCAYCQCPVIQNGLGVVAARRNCSPGRQCRGGELRGAVCNRSCTTLGASRQTLEAYVNQVCTDKRNQGTFGDLTGQGSQMTYYEDRACNIFCDTRNPDGSVIRKSWGDRLPDGTPCGNNKYCLEGKCLTLACDSTALLTSASECTSELEKCLPALSEVKVTWTGWSAWSGCSSSCGAGLKSRARSCVTIATSFSASVVASGCDGHEAEKASCSLAACPGGKMRAKKAYFTPYTASYNEYDSWSVWSLCSQTCGEGMQWRQRACSAGKCWGASRQERPCFIEACTQWGGWGYWSSCSPASRQRRRIRKCYGRETCPGNELEVDNC